VSKYRLLDAEEQIQIADEVRDSGVWETVPIAWVGLRSEDASPRPFRRLDDGKGAFIQLGPEDKAEPGDQMRMDGTWRTIYPGGECMVGEQTFRRKRKSVTYRLIEFGERLQPGDQRLGPRREWCDVVNNIAEECVTALPFRRPDDGKGKWVLLDLWTEFQSDDEIWFNDTWTSHSMTGWVGGEVMRRRRLVQMFALIEADNVLCTGSEANCRSEAAKCVAAFPEKMYRVCKMVDVAIYRTQVVTENKVVIEVVGK
jgi:hypothetical protein